MEMESLANEDRWINEHNDALLTTLKIANNNVLTEK